MRIKRVFATLILCLYLSLTALAGHTTPGGAYCDGVCVQSKCSVCGAACTDGNAPISQDESKGASTDMPEDVLVIAFLLFMVYRFRS
jgi:hypothetical protein